MKVKFTSFNAHSYASASLAIAHRVAKPFVEELASQYTQRDDDRVLVIVFHCPCCMNDPLMSLENAVFVSPFCGISGGREVHCVKVCPPAHREGSEKERTETMDEFIGHVKTTIETALAE